jgi:hypothetical protein
MMETADHKPLVLKISGAMRGVDIDRLSNAIEALCKGWINSHEDKENQETSQETSQEPSTRTRQGEGPGEPPRPRNIPDPKGCDTRHSNLAAVRSGRHIEY